MHITDTNVEAALRHRLEEIHSLAPDSIGSMMNYELTSCDPGAGTYTFRCGTFDWMRNIPGTLHGGMCATIVDQAMGFVAYCIKPGEGIAPTVQLSVNYHRPIIPGDRVAVRVEVVSVSRTLMHLSAQVYREEAPEKICLSATSVFFYKSAD